MHPVKTCSVCLRRFVFPVSWLWVVFIATTVSMADQATEDPPPTDHPVTAAKAAPRPDPSQVHEDVYINYNG